MKIVDVNQIKEILNSVDILAEIEAGFVAYSEGACVLPSPSDLHFTHPPGEVHIKSGYIQGDDYYVVKIASGFYDNSRFNVPSSNGLMLLFSQKTGELVTVLLDEGYLTDLRTAAAGAIVAKYLAPRTVTQIGIVGTGTQAKLQLGLLKRVTACRNVMVYGRNPQTCLRFQTDMQHQGFKVEITQNLPRLTSSCNLIVTTTPSTTPLVYAQHIQPGTHITAIGADTAHKQELDENIFSMADIIVTDSLSQCRERGDISHAFKRKLLKTTQITELGNIISGKSHGRRDENQITIADLTGLAVQDLQIAKAVNKSYHHF